MTPSQEATGAKLEHAIECAFCKKLRVLRPRLAVCASCARSLRLDSDSWPDDDTLVAP